MREMTDQTQPTEQDDGITVGAGFGLAEPAPAAAEEESPKADPAPAAEAGEAQPAAEDAGTPEGDDDDSGEKPEEKQKPKASDRIRELSRKNRELIARLDAIENRLPAEKTNDTPVVEDKSPDPSDFEKYPLGALDDRYIEDMIEHVTNRKVAETLESVRQREAETAQQAETERQNAQVLEKANTVIASGSELFDDFEESVVVPALQGKFDLTQVTFEAIAEVENGARILHALASDTKEAARVAQLSPFQQLKYVSEKDAEFSEKKPAPRLPKAQAPPQSGTKGSGTKFTVPDDTDDQDAFDKKFFAKR
jgi:hypothetical protein